MAEFLPFCDVLFNVISLAGYFCDVVFDIVMGYALLERGYKGSFAAAISIVITSLIISQVISLRWYLNVWWGEEGRKGRPPWLPIALHCLQLGVLWRYARLLVPVDLRLVKHQVRDLCMLRLVHAFCEAAPMLLLQLHVLFKPQPEDQEDGTMLEPLDSKWFSELAATSASLSLLSVCWALASFNKNVRRRNVHRLVLTWLGVIFQLVWRAGTVSARVCALTVYALVYEYWLFLVIGLHWVAMFLWLLAGGGGGAGAGGRRRCAALAAVYVLAYVNLTHRPHHHYMTLFYVVMCVENCVLIAAWWWSGRAQAPGAVAGGAAAACLAGLAAMAVYYRYFHVRRLGYMLGENQQGANSTNASANHHNGKVPIQSDNAAIPGVFNCRFTNPVNSGANCRKKKKPTSFVPPPAARAPPAFWRRPLPPNMFQGGSSENEGSSVGSRVNIQQKLQEKKQKQLAELRVIEEEIKQGKLAKTTPAADEIYSSLQRQPIPRAKTHAEPLAWPSIEMTHSYQNYPVPQTHNIYPTYTEIKSEFKNFQTKEPDLKILRYNNQENRTFYETPTIRNEINRTPMRSPNYLLERNPDYGTRILNNSPRNYIPDVTNTYDAAIDKTRTSNAIFDQPEYPYAENGQNYSKDEYVSALHNALTSVQSIENMRYEDCAQFGQECDRYYPALGKKVDRKLARCRTPEILLAPHYLEGCNRQVCCNWGAPYTNRTLKKEDGCASSGEGSNPEPARDTPRPPSDIDSQISLPRSYTLPREFRYWRRRPRLRDAHVPSNNSSDGDVDSGDNESSRGSACSRDRRPPDRRRRPQHKTETQL